MADYRDRDRRRAEHAELTALLELQPYCPDPYWYERYWYTGADRGRLGRSAPARGWRKSGQRNAEPGSRGALLAVRGRRTT